MRSRLAVLMLMGVLILMSAINLPAAPRPGPAWAILDIGPPDKGRTAEEHCEQEIRALTRYRHGGYLWLVEIRANVKKLPSVARLKEEEVGPWLERSIRVKEERGGRHLRLTFGAGTRPEQVVILNALLVDYTGDSLKQNIKRHEEALQPLEKMEARYAKAIKEECDPEQIAELQKLVVNRRAGAAPIRAEVDRLKQVAIVKWAK